MNSLLLWIGGLVVAALALLFAAPYAIDWNTYRDVFEEEASRILGRDVRVAGDVNLRLLPVPYVSFEKISIADAGGRREEPFFAAESFTLWLSIAPLLRGTIEANDVELDGAKLKLAMAADGTGNWQTFKLSPGALPFVPSDVALKSVKVTNGEISILANGGETTVAAVEGEFSAAGLDGPYKFRGDASWNDARWDVRVSTATREPDGNLRLKLTARAAETGNSYLLDATASPSKSGPRLEGTGTAQLVFGGPAGGASEVPVRFGGGQRPANTFAVQAAVSADVRGASLKDIALAFEQEGRPQLISGDVQFSWGRQLDTRAEFKSRWLDLDQLLSAGEEACPSSAVHALVQRTALLLPTERRASLKLGVDLINLGGESISGLELAVAREGGALAIRELKAGLPGAAEIEVRGSLGGERASEGFDGELRLEGPSLQRFLAWAGKCHLGSLKADGTFLLSSKLRFRPGQVELTGGILKIGGKQTQIGLDYRPGDNGTLKLDIRGEDVDLAPFAPGILDIETLGAALGGRSGAGDAQLPISDVAKANVELQVRAGALGDGERTLRDVNAELALKDGALKVSVLKFASQDGIRAEVQGEIAQTANGPRGKLSGQLVAEDRRAVRAMGTALAAIAGDLDLVLRNSGSARLNFSADLGTRTPKAVLIKTDGTIDNSRLSAELQLGNGLAAWRESPLEISLKMESPDLRGLVQQLTGVRSAADAVPAGTGPGSLEVKLKGQSATDLQAVAALRGPDLEISYKGGAGLGAEGRLEAVGEIALSGGDAGGAIGVSRKRDALRLEPRGVRLGTSRLSGRIDVAGTGPRQRIDARLEATQASLTGLLDPILARAPSASVESPSTASAASVWPDMPFSFDRVEGLEGRLELAAGSVLIAEGVTLRNVSVDVELAPYRVIVKKLASEALGGRLDGAFTLDRIPAGAALSGDLKLKGVQLGELARLPDGKAGSAAGELNVSLHLNGRALTPRALVAAMTGKGEAEIRGGRVAGLAPDAIAKAAAAFLGAPDDPNRGFVSLLRAALTGSSLPLGTRKIGLEVADGALKVARFAAETPEGNATNDTTIDLGALKVDSEWRLEPKREAAQGGRARQPLPGVSVVYVGPLTQLAAIEPRIAADSLERELSVRRMEREVDRLENLRKQDQDRARKEFERKQGAAGSLGTGAGVIQVPLPVPAPGAPSAPSPR